jgi:hypothetical protein
MEPLEALFVGLLSFKHSQTSADLARGEACVNTAKAKIVPEDQHVHSW